MAVTPQFLEAEWPLTEIREIREYAGHEAYEIIARQGRYVLKFGGSWVSREDIRRSIAVCAFLQEKGFSSCPRIVATRHGEKFRPIGERFAYLYEHIPGSPPKDDPDNHRELGLLAGRLNSIKDFPCACPITVDSIRPEMLSYAGEVPFGAEYRKVAESLPSLEGLPAGIIHADLSLGNSIEKPSGELVLLDWDESGTGPRILDAGYPLIGIFLGEDLKFDRAKAQAFYAAYQSAVSFTKEERALLFSASLFYALWYVRFANPEARWRRIQHALANREKLQADALSS